MSGIQWAVAAMSGSAALWASMVTSSYCQQNRDALDRQFQSAVSHYNAAQYQEAVNELEELVARVPLNFDVQELLGLVYSAETKDQEARLHFEKAVQQRPNSGPARANLAVNLSKLGKNDEAEAQFKKAIALEPSNYDANHNFGEFYVRAGKIAAAIPFLENAQHADPSSYNNGYDLSLAYTNSRRLGDARRLITDLLKQQNTAELHNLLAEVEEKDGKFVTAANEYELAAHLDPSESNLFDWGGELLVHQTTNPAIDVFSEGLKRFPNSARLSVGLGLALYIRGSYDDAVKALMHATDLAPADPHTYFFLSRAYDRSPSQADEVVERFRRFGNLRPQDAEAAYYYAMSLWKGRRSETSQEYLDQVQSLLKKAIALDASSGEAHLQLANLYSQRRQYAEAVPEYQLALKLSSDIADAHFRLGQAYVHLGNKDLANEQFKLHQEYRERHLAEIDKQRLEIQQFIYSTKGSPAGQ
jgi:tetratricopeptide (TPR) repeat protein